MTVTKAIQPESLQFYFAEFTRRFLQDGSPEAADVEVVDNYLGSQLAIEGARLLGISFDPQDQALEFELDVGGHRVFDPQQVWALEESEGFVNSIALMLRDGSREISSIKRVGLRRLD